MLTNTRRLFLFVFLFGFLIPTHKAWSTCSLTAPVVSAPLVSSCEITLSWISQPNAAYYIVKYKVKGQTSWLGTFNAGLSTTYSITGLLANTKYTLLVLPYCSNNQPGSPSKKTVTTAACSRPENVLATNIDNTSATISWSICGPANQTFMRIRVKGTNQWTIVPAGFQTSQNISGLIPATIYQYQVNACDTSTKSLWTSTATFTTLATPAWQPNVLLIYLDDCRYDVFAPNGGPSFFNTPAINSIAEEGINFKWCFPALSLCSPSRASIVSGLYPHHHGVFSNADVDTFAHITLAQIMHDNGYYVGFVGKYAFQKFPVPGYDYYCNSSSDEYWDTRYQYNSKTFITIPGHKTNIFTYKALEFLNQVPPGKRFMLFLAHKAPHVPYDPRPEDEGLFDSDDMPFPDNYDPYTKNIPSHYYDCDHQYPTPNSVTKNYKDYFELINGAEWSIDTILNVLQQKNLLDSTLIIFTSDNGLLMGEHELGGKELALEQSIQLPMFIRYPKWFAPNTINTSDMAMNIDIAPTVLDAAGIPDTFHMDGVSMRALANGTLHRKELFYEFFYRYNCNPTFQCVRDFQYKYVHNQCSSASEEFYDLVSDPLETQNLIYAPNYASLVALYKAKLDSLEDYYGYVNISDVTLDCSLGNVDSSVILFKSSTDIGSHPVTQLLYPNPVHDHITLSNDAAEEADLYLSIVDVFSQPVHEEEVHVYAGHNLFTIDVSGFMPGTYIVNIVSKEKHQSLMFVKQ